MNKWKKWFARPAAAVLCTGVLALALSAVPALTLWLGDAGLLAQPHARTQKVINGFSGVLPPDVSFA